ncbi:MAG: amidohydrolase family protein [Halanaerobiales bacterium]|nr:amidohydrolase family protein [Halanaerobiales bacterium]
MKQYVLGGWVAPITHNGILIRDIYHQSYLEIQDGLIRKIGTFDGLLFDENQLVLIDKNKRITIDKTCLLPLEIQKYSQVELEYYLRSTLITPGFINAHTHTLEALFQGFYTYDQERDQPFHYRNMLDWLKHPTKGAVPIGLILANSEEIIQNVLGENIWKIAFRKAYFDQIRSGVTYFRDHLWNMGSIIPSVIEESKELDVKFTLGIDCFPSNVDLLGGAVSILNDFHKQENIQFELAGTDIAVIDLLSVMQQVSRDFGIGVHLHMAETVLQRKIYKNSLQYLIDAQVLGPQLSLAHSVYLDEREYDILASTGTKVVINDRANGYLGSKKAPLSKFLKHNVICGLGTDGAATIGLDMFSLLHLSVCTERMFMEDPTVIDAFTILALATYGSAQTLGLEAQMGSLEVGKKANLNIFRLKQPIYNPIDTLIFLTRTDQLMSVIVEGKEIYKGGHVEKIEDSKLEDHLETIADFIKIHCR